MIATAGMAVATLCSPIKEGAEANEKIQRCN